MSRVVVCGSLNMDLVVQSVRRPRPGETLLGAKVSYLPGGKGLNQAVAAARLGVATSMMGAVGLDPFGDTLRDFLTDNGIDVSGVRTVKGEPTGVALIQVMSGQNAITVASGANMHFTKAMAVRAPRRGDVWVAQFETPIETTEALLVRARLAGARTVLNLAPMAFHPRRLLKCVDVAVMNSIELSQATGKSLRDASSRRVLVDACNEVLGRGTRAVIASLGEYGSIVATRDGATIIPALHARVVDTTGAGDCFVGALAARLSAGADLLDAARYANAAASCSVERLGAAPSMPTPREVAARLSRA
jgi:ribokinase